MFWGATSFSSDISNWDVSSVCNMHGMFMDAAAFNIDISKWDVSRVVAMDCMFWSWQATSAFKQKLSGAAWVHSKASKKGMFTGSSGSVAQQLCILTPPHQHVSRQPFPERELIFRAPITTPAYTRTLAITSSNKMVCPKCGTFKKSGRVSCCASGGAWYKNCGDASNKNAGHMWSEGFDACKRKSKANVI